MLQLRNKTPLPAHIAVLPDENGVDTLFVAVKATFSISDRPVLAEIQVPVVLADVYWGEPGTSSLKYASEVHLRKPATDIVLVGSACAKAGRPVPSVDVEMSVAEGRKIVRVFGDRQWKCSGGGVSATPPKPFETLPLVYERAFGGVFTDPATGKVHAEERNPVGTGFAGPRKDGEMADLPLPNLESPATPIRSPLEVVDPAGFGFIAPSWLPRRAFAGTYDAAWQAGRAPYLPADFDLRFFNMAPPEMVFDRHLQGGEPVHLKNASLRTPLLFQLPVIRPSVSVRIAGATESPPAALETVLIEPDLERFCLTWRAAVPCDKKALRVEEIVIDAAGLVERAGG